MRFETIVLSRDTKAEFPFWFIGDSIHRDLACIGMIEEEFEVEGHDDIIIVFSTEWVRGAVKQTERLYRAGYYAMKRLGWKDRALAEGLEFQFKLYWWVEFPK